MSALVDRPSETTLVQRQLFLSRFTLDQRHGDMRVDLANSQAMHRRLLDAFPNVRTREECGLLYRIDQIGQMPTARLIVLAQSAIEPDWTALPAGYAMGDGIPGWELVSPVDVKPIGAILSAIDRDDIYRFRLRANPTKRMTFKTFQAEKPDWASEKRRAEGPRLAIHDQEGLQAWIERKGEQHGFRVGSMRIVPDPVTGGRQRGQKRRGDETLALTHDATLFDGMLQVADADEFRKSIASGVGGGKAYGFGLLSIAAPGTLP